MAPKKGKGKKGKKKKLKGMVEHPGDLVKKLQRIYVNNCNQKKSAICPGIKSLMKRCAEDDKLIVKFILEPIPSWEDPELSNVQLEPLLMAIRHERYKWIKEVHIWEIPLKHEDVASLALTLEKGPYPIHRLELFNCDLQAYALERLLRNASSFTTPLTILNLDDNQFGDEGVKGLCKGLKNNKTLLSLSLCYCDLGVESGIMLGEILSSTAIRDVYLNGNNLETEGAIELVKLLADHAEMESWERADMVERKAEEEAEAALLAKEKERVETAMSGDSKPGSAKSKKILQGKKKKRKGKRSKKSKGPPPPPPVGPLIHKLHLADNGIDSYGKGSTYGPVIAMRLFRKLIQHSECLKELDLDDNQIGDLGGRQVMEGLEQRASAGLPGMKVSVTHMMNGQTFSSIMKLGAGLKKKKKKGKGKKKKKK
ncbi:ribonuclease inhibitor-like [Anneissia japonica]|uniref:ribonuclease inhibitor-like n=1 Tax=Anneissia japonica TaxID=1529436 RepID=UPI001425B130|nr:ribonuclease inhibitor-like [Anneissia japonica]